MGNNLRLDLLTSVLDKKELVMAYIVPYLSSLAFLLSSLFLIRV